MTNFHYIFSTFETTVLDQYSCAIFYKKIRAVFLSLEHVRSDSDSVSEFAIALMRISWRGGKGSDLFFSFFSVKDWHYILKDIE
jgi:hypothetical protein